MTSARIPKVQIPNSHIAKSQPSMATQAVTASSARRPAADPLDVAALPVEQRSLVMRLSEEVAALRRALEASHHRIATLEVEASEDPLSGLLNQRAFLREIERAILFQARYRMTCGIALIDVSGIATIAAEHGHAAGNAALRRLGGVFRAGIRSCDVAARTGNEQFGVVLWNSAFADCAQRVAGLEQAISLCATGFEGLGAPQSRLGSRSAVAMIEPGMTPDALMASLDAILADRPVRR